MSRLDLPVSQLVEVQVLMMSRSIGSAAESGRRVTMPSQGSAARINTGVGLATAQRPPSVQCSGLWQEQIEVSKSEPVLLRFGGQLERDANLATEDAVAVAVSKHFPRSKRHGGPRKQPRIFGRHSSTIAGNDYTIRNSFM